MQSARTALTWTVLAPIVCFAHVAPAQDGQSKVYSNNVLPLLDQDKPVFGMFVNYIGIGADRESAVSHARNPNVDFVVYDLEHTPFDLSTWRGAFSRARVVRHHRHCADARGEKGGREVSEGVDLRRNDHRSAADVAGAVRAECS
jgi:hypothetical protein